MNPYVKYLKDGALSKDEKKAYRLRVKATHLCLINDHLYRCSYGDPYLKCVQNDKAEYLLAEVHEGQCSNHSRRQSLAHKILSQGYYWPTIHTDATTHV